MRKGYLIYNEVNNLNNNNYGGARLVVNDAADLNDDIARGETEVDFVRAEDLYPFVKCGETEDIMAAYYDNLATLRFNIGGTATAAEKQALIDLLLPPNI